MDVNNRKILVTGGCGFIGSHIAHALANLGHQVTVVDVIARHLRDDVKSLSVDIAEEQDVIDACKGMDSVIHCASLVQTTNVGRERIWQVNYDGTRNVIVACQTHEIPRLTYISSASVVYAGADIENADETYPYVKNPSSAYVKSKLAAEHAVLALNETSSIRTCALRPHLVFGPSDQRFIPNILQRAKAGKLSREIGNRSKLSDFTYISNLVDATVLAEEKLGTDPSLKGEVFFITNGEPKAFFQFVEEFLLQLGYPPIKGKVPYWLAYAGAAVIELYNFLRFQGVQPESGISRFSVKYQATHHYYSIEKARRKLGWQPKVSLSEGIKLTAEDLLSQGLGNLPNQN